jgi:hypothetical protein
METARDLSIYGMTGGATDTSGIAVVIDAESSVARAVRDGWDSGAKVSADRRLISRRFGSLAVAAESAARLLPVGTPVRWRGATGSVGMFLTGLPEIGPGIGDLVPAIILFPTNRQVEVVTLSAMANVLERGVSKLIARGSEMLSADELRSGRTRMERTLDRLRAGAPPADLTFGPAPHLDCSALIVPLADIRARGFAEGWTERQPAQQHPVLGDVDGVLQREWDEAVRAGAQAKAKYLQQPRKA